MTFFICIFSKRQKWASSLVPLKRFTPASVAIGVMVVPDNSAYRFAARQTWIPEAKQHATVRFVAGDMPCARTAMRD